MNGLTPEHGWANEGAGFRLAPNWRELLMEHRQVRTDLMVADGNGQLLATLTSEVPAADLVGAGLGIVSTATTSDGDS
jgi:hypothetical protein